MADEDTAEIDQHPELLVGDFERNEGMPRMLRIQVTGCVMTCRGPVREGANGNAALARPRLTSNAGKFGEVVDDGFAGMDMVIDCRNASLWAFTAEDRHSCENLSRWSEDLLGAIGMKLGFLLLQ